MILTNFKIFSCGKFRIWGIRRRNNWVSKAKCYRFKFRFDDEGIEMQILRTRIFIEYR